MRQNLCDATEEISRRSDAIWQLGEGEILTDFPCLRPRLLKIMGYLAAYSLHCKISGENGWRSEVLDALLDKYFDVAFRFTPEHPFGEAAFPLLLMIAWYMELTGRIVDASSIVGNLVDMTLLMQKRGGLVNPYYSSGLCISHHLGINKIDESFTGHSYCLRALVEWLARRLWRQHIRLWWRSISHIQNCEFVPDDIWGYYIWQCDKGEEQNRFPNQEQSWADLRKGYSDDLFPQTLCQIPSFLPFFLVCYPHRFSAPMAWKMDQLLE